MKTSEIRQLFLSFFKQHEHEVVPGSSLIPIDDPSLLFVNAGMVPFKHYFLGSPTPYPCAASAQACLRVGGKHNDLKQVGHTTRHHTLFEMLGNFSFGDYFKEKAIKMAWSFITESLQLDPNRLWITVHHTDDESADIWANQIGVAKDRIIRLGDEDNFWSMGDTGPCGPCTEIFYDHGPEVAGGPPGSPDAEGDRYVEIWNLVFMQYDRQADGELKTLPSPCVDTGMGIERIAAVMQGVYSNFDIDIFQTLMSAIETRLGVALPKTTLQVIADHLRSAVFIIANGIEPSNEGRAYVLRRIIRRALRYAYQADVNTPFLHQFVDDLVMLMGEAYPILQKEQARIADVIRVEEEKFFKTLEQGMLVLESALKENQVISGELAFKLYDTYGFPIDIAEDIAEERGIEIDMAGYHAAMDMQRARSQSAAKFHAPLSASIGQIEDTHFIGQVMLSAKAKVVALLRDGERVDVLRVGEEGIVILDQTPFYPAGGGQVGDEGELVNEHAFFSARDTQKQGEVILHHGEMIRGEIRVGDQLDAIVDQKRLATKRHHSATHLLHAALRQILGDQVEQKGSLVDDTRLRFDFSYPTPLTHEQKASVECLVNEVIYAAMPVEVAHMPIDEAIAQGAIALFSEKYQDDVRVLSMGDFSKELCGGTHVENTNEIGLFKIIAESGVASGVRRIEAVAGDRALQWYQAQVDLLTETAHVLKTQPAQLTQRVQQLLDEQKKLKKQLAQSHHVGAKSLEPHQLGDYQIYCQVLTDSDMSDLMRMVDQYKSQSKAIIVLCAQQTTGQHPLVIAINDQALSTTLDAQQICQALQAHLAVKGGGRKDLVRGVCIDAPKDLVKQVQAVLATLV